MGAEGIVGDNSFFHQIGALWSYSRVEMLAEITIGPAIEGTILHCRHVIRHEIGTELIALIDDRPPCAGLWLKGKPVRIAQSAREDAPSTRGPVQYSPCCSRRSTCSCIPATPLKRSEVAATRRIAWCQHRKENGPAASELRRGCVLLHHGSGPHRTYRVVLRSHRSRLQSHSNPQASRRSCLIKDRDALLAFYDFPAEHWKHLRTTNVIESSFATVRHRTVRSKGCLSNKTALAMIFKLAEAAEKSWRRLNGHNQLPKLILGVKFTDGIEVVRSQAQAAAA